MKKKACLLLIASSMVLSGCWFTDMIKKWFGKEEPNQQQNEDNNNHQEKTIVSIISVNAPQQIEQGQTLSAVQLVVGYSDGSTGTVQSTSVSLDTSTVGTATGTATVGGVSATFTIEVYSNSIPTHHGTFLSTSAVAGDGYTDITLKNASNDAIEVRAEKVDYNGTTLTAAKNSYFVMYNKVTSPLNDISDLSCAWNNVPALASSENVAFALYFSYNFLSLDDIFAGYYQDLATYTSTFSVNGNDDSFSTSSSGIVAPNARYFLALVQTPSSDLSLLGMQIVSNNSEAPAPVDKGVYAYPSEINGKFGGFSNGLPFIGNGSIAFDIDDDDADFVAFQRQGKCAWFVSELLSNGFVYATELMGMEVYQKPFDNAQSYTYAISKIAFNGYELFNVSYAGLIGTMIEETSWPGDTLKAGLTNDALKALVIDPQFTGSVSYVTLIQQEDCENAAGVMVTQKDENQRAQYVANGNILKNYMQGLVTNHGLIRKSEWGGDFTDESFYYESSVRSADYRFEIEGTIMFDPDGVYNILQLSFTEIMFGAFPTNVVRTFYADNSFPVLSSASGEFSYSSSDDVTVTGLNVTQAELETYWTALENYGFHVSNSSSSEYRYYSASKLVVNSLGAFNYNISAYLYADHMKITYSKSNANYDSSFANAMNKINYNSLGQDIATAVGDEFSNGHFVYDYNTKNLYAIGYGQTEAQQLLNACEFDAVLNCYVFYVADSPSKGAYRISVEVMDNYLIIHASYINSSAWCNYKNEDNTTNVNGIIDEIFDYGGRSDASDYYLGTTQLVFSHDYYSYNITAYGSTVASAINTYKTSLLANTNIQYSAYLDKYINTSTGVGVEFDMHDEEVIPYAIIRFSFYNDFVDYVKYSEIASDLAAFTHLNVFPSMNVLGENEAGFVFGSADENYAYVYMTEAAYNAYFAIVESNNNFVETNYGNYDYADADGNLYHINFSEYNHSVYLTYTASYFTTITAIKEEYDANSFTFYENYILPTQSGNIFRSTSYWDSYFSIEYAKNAFDLDAYKAALVAGGFKEAHGSSNNVIYAKIVGHVSYIVDFDNNYIYYRTATYDMLLSYEDLVAAISNNGFDPAKLDNFVKIDGMENNYFNWNCYSNEFTTLISNGDVTVEAYVTALLNAGYVADAERPGYYNKGETVVYVYDSDGFLVIRYHDERIIYKTFAEVVAKAVSQGFDSRVLDHVLAPTQTGSIYALAYSSTNRIELYYDANVFDVDAYKQALVDAGYTKNGNYYEKGDAEVYISTSSHRIELSYDGTLD